MAEDTKFAKCKKCDQAVSRGGDTARTFNTSNLVSHLKTKHSEEYQQYRKTDDVSKESFADEQQAKRGSRQLTLQESSERAKRWDINDPPAQNIHTKIGEMIALDYQPFSIVEDVGFSRLLHSIEPRYKLPSYITEEMHCRNS